MYSGIGCCELATETAYSYEIILIELLTGREGNGWGTGGVREGGREGGLWVFQA